MRRWSLFAIGLAVYVLALIAQAPATLVDLGLQRASAGRLRVAEARGTLWSGAGQLEFRDAAGRAGLAKPVAWRLRPGKLLLARLAYEVEFDPGSRPFPLTVSWSRIELANLDTSLPAAALGLVLPRLAPFGLAGDVSLHVPSLSLGRGATRGSATLRWRAASSALSPVSPLGDYELRFEGDGPAIRTTLKTLQGPLQLDGQGLSASGRQSVFVATARMPAEFRPRLAPLLRLIAVERGDGSFEWRLR